MKTFLEFLLNEEGPMGGMGAMGGAPLGADPMGGGMGAPMGGPMGGGTPPMGGPMGGDPMGGMGMGGPPMGGAPPTEQVPISIKDADVWKVFDHLLNKKPLPKEQEKQSPFSQDNADPMGGAADPMGGMGGDPMSPPPNQGGMPGSPSPMGGPPMGGGLMS